MTRINSRAEVRYGKSKRKLGWEKAALLVRFGPKGDRRHSSGATFQRGNQLPGPSMSLPRMANQKLLD
ncbi:hypothetical protein [Rhizobium sp. BK376]|uniref:hypothetical protein n=1 Tax=Rhizobium sp. BK376 TaxID=2512149 RepID=UPI00104B649A|nr:hypothetical protein [Rhizobium sp. BK376]